jgi:ADP-heptose:LPS heptosyltransferase
MGFGDDIMATGFARGAIERGKKIAFGDGRKIIWGPWSAEMFANNPNVATPGQEFAPNVEWLDYYKGHRKYNYQEDGKWIWNYDFKTVPGQFYFDEAERKLAQDRSGFVVIEPNVPWQKQVAPNKDWGEENYREVARQLFDRGFNLVQFKHKNSRRIIEGAKLIEQDQFRKAISIMSKAALYLGPEGGMHHAAAAVGIPGVVIFGGFIPPAVTGYRNHINLTGGVEACGNIKQCVHCMKAMTNITVEEVLASCMKALKK